MLAGGLTTANVGEAVAQVRPWGVDVATGVESSPGRKDPRKLRAFVLAAKGGRALADGGTPSRGHRRRRRQPRPASTRRPVTGFCPR